jgi:hypothetical protein
MLVVSRVEPLALPQLFFAQQVESFGQGDDANPHQDQRANDTPRDVGRLDHGHDDGNGAEEGQATDALRNATTKDQ